MGINGLKNSRSFLLLACSMLFAAAHQETVLAQSIIAPARQMHDESTAKLGAKGKSIKGFVTSQEIGDVACYLNIRDDAGRETTEMADFELCTRNPKLQGKSIELGFTPRQVMDESCGGDPACKKTRQVQIATTVKVFGDSAQAPPSSRTVGRASHCTAAEMVVFACRTGTKLVSICADPASAPKKGYMQYRFGKLGDRETLDINWPENGLPPSVMSTGDADAFSGGGAAWLRIRKGDYAYVVYSGIGRWGPNGQTQVKEGVLVERGAKVITSLKCTQPATSELGPAWFGQVGIQSRGEIFDLPD